MAKRSRGSSKRELSPFDRKLLELGWILRYTDTGCLAKLQEGKFCGWNLVLESGLCPDHDPSYQRYFAYSKKATEAYCKREEGLCQSQSK